MLEDFFDSEYVSQSYSAEDETYTVNLVLWNAKPAKIVFSGVIGFQVLSIAEPRGLRYETLPSQFFYDALSALYVKVPEQHEYKCFEIVNVDEMPFIKIASKMYEHFSE
jgi:hypothetical protein